MCCYPGKWFPGSGFRMQCCDSIQQSQELEGPEATWDKSVEVGLHVSHLFLGYVQCLTYQ